MDFHRMVNTALSGRQTGILLLLSAILSGCLPQTSPQETPPDAGRVILDTPGFPYVFELNSGESHTISRRFDGGEITRTLQVLSVRTFTEPNLWFSRPLAPENYSRAEVAVRVSGKDTVLMHRPNQMPLTFNGLRLYVETVKEWAENTEIADLNDVQKEVRLSVCAENEPWGPESIRFPVADYRWRSAAYNNTWSSLVPYNKLYYHRGEDYGAIPDRLDVRAIMDGVIRATPLPEGDGKSNAILIQHPSGIISRTSHMNTETLRPEYPQGTRVTAGTVLAKTGMTWDGRKSQVNDPHCHVELMYGETKLASYPYLMEAYLREYPDPVLAVAGGYQFTLPGQEVCLDGSRSISRTGTQPLRYQWKLHTGQTLDTSSVALTYREPGLYTEELRVFTAEGNEDRDFVQIRVFDPERGSDLAYGWAYYYPVRNIRPGTEVLFWSRLANITAPVQLDFGDGSPPQIIDRECTHAYDRAGIYTVTLRSTGPAAEPVSVKLEVHVE
jgi:murein DD-endopeptidase MepM/ murein hydrolase activator NlpD